jgi:hypothetical protein
VTIDRRSLLKFVGLAPLMGAAPQLLWATDVSANEPPD